MSKDTRSYIVELHHHTGLVVRTVEFDGRKVIAASLHGESVVLDDRCRRIVEALLRAHEKTHRGTGIVVRVSPVPLKKRKS